MKRITESSLKWFLIHGWLQCNLPYAWPQHEVRGYNLPRKGSPSICSELLLICPVLKALSTWGQWQYSGSMEGVSLGVWSAEAGDWVGSCRVEWKCRQQRGERKGSWMVAIYPWCPEMRWPDSVAAGTDSVSGDISAFISRGETRPCFLFFP